jgi:hypothetical protein
MQYFADLPHMWWCDFKVLAQENLEIPYCLIEIYE